jgi:hypothetical protein
MTTRQRQPWDAADILDKPPNARLLRWVRLVILIGWAVLLGLNLPVVILEVQRILSSMPPGPARHATVEKVVLDAIGYFVCLPLFVLGLFGYGVAPRIASSVWTTGGPWFVPIWRSKSEPKRRSKKHSTDS